MGYTHYFTGLRTDATFSKCIQDIIDVAQEHGIRVRDGWGDGEAIVTNTRVALNGDTDNGLDHETFSISDGSDGFNFCKTARKPYDSVVVAILILAIVNEQPGWEEIQSDGTWGDWVDAHGGYDTPIGGVALYEETFGPLSDTDKAKVMAQIGA
jgi:hypothetical protein